MPVARLWLHRITPYTADLTQNLLTRRCPEAVGSASLLLAQVTVTAAPREPPKSQELARAARAAPAAEVWAQPLMAQPAAAAVLTRVEGTRRLVDQEPRQPPWELATVAVAVAASGRQWWALE